LRHFWYMTFVFPQAAYTSPVLMVAENVIAYLKGQQTYRWNDSLVGIAALITAGIPQ
jgi:hypothetical protein